MLAWASPENLNQQRISLVADPGRIALARSRDVEGLNVQSAQPFPDCGSRFRVSGIENEQRASETERTPGCPIGPRILIHGAWPQDQGSVGVADVPFRPLRRGTSGAWGLLSCGVS